MIIGTLSGWRAMYTGGLYSSVLGSLLFIIGIKDFDLNVWSVIDKFTYFTRFSYLTVGKKVLICDTISMDYLGGLCQRNLMREV